MNSSIMRFAAALAIGSGLVLGAALTPAHAGLGDTAASVRADLARLKGELRVRPGVGYSVERITTPAGTVVKEFVSPSGRVFAISWRGRAMPDLRQLLGPYFTQLQSAEQARHAAHPRAGHDRLQVREPTLVVHAGGHMRQYFGVAYVPSLLPPNVSAADLR